MPPTAPPPIDKVDPARAWQPWEPGAKDPFNLKWAGHLFRRAGLGTSLDELRTAVEKGLDATLARLLDGDKEAKVLDLEQAVLSAGDRTVSGDDKTEELRGWWVYCMLYTAHPLREKLTLFWHNHFATSIAKVQPADADVRPEQAAAQARAGQVSAVPARRSAATRR